MRSVIYRWSLASALFLVCQVLPASGACCVWKVTGPHGGTLFLGGSWHALRSTDYPLPAPYNRAFDASTRLAFEISPRDFNKSGNVLDHMGKYGWGDNLKKHVDPRTYDYVRRVFALFHIPESKFDKFKAWYLSLALESPQLHGLSEDLGVETFFQRRAEANSKPIVGLESLREHMEIFSGLSDRSSEALLLITFIPADKESPDFMRLMHAWRTGDADFIAQATRGEYKEFPAMADRVLDNRNANWIPKLERFVNSGTTYFVIAGAAHMGGPHGVVALLRERGYKVDQL